MTIQTYAIIEGEDVINTILWDDVDEYQAPEGTSVILANEEIGIGWKHQVGEWIPPIPPTPEPPPEIDTVRLAAQNSAAQQLIALGISEANARLIVGLPPKE